MSIKPVDKFRVKESSRFWWQFVIGPSPQYRFSDAGEDGIRTRAGRLVKEFMIPIKATIDHDDHLMKAMCEMVDQNTSLLPVLRDDTVVGVVRSVDVLSEIALMLGS